MKKILKTAITLLLCFGLCVCSQEEIIKYDLNIISPSFENVYTHYNANESDTEKYILSSASGYSEFITEETLPFFESITICDESIDADTANAIISLAKEINVPVFFLMNDIDREIINSYDKAFCISADYSYIGEMFANKINEIWKTGIADKDGNQIFSFSVIQPETMNNVQQKFYESMLKNIELLGIPLEQLEEIYLSKGDVLNYCTDNKKKNEAFFILDSNYLNVFPDAYEPYGEGIEILGIEFGIENSYTAYPYMLMCFIDYTEYFDARDAIMANINAKVYPFKNLDYSIIDKYLYIPATI